MKKQIYQFYLEDGDPLGLFLVPEDISYEKMCNLYQEWYEFGCPGEFEETMAEEYGITDIERIYVDHEYIPIS